MGAKQEISSRHPGEACAMAGSLGAHALLFVFAALALTLSTASQKIYSDESVPLGEAGGKNCSAQTQKEYYEMWQSANVKLGTALQSADYCHHAQDMLSGTQLQRTLTMKKMVKKHVAQAVEVERNKLAIEKQELHAFKLEQCNSAPTSGAAQCVKEKIKTIQMSSRSKICEARVSSLHGENQKIKANHRAEMTKVRQSVKKLNTAAGQKGVAAGQKGVAAGKQQVKPQKKKTLTETHVHLLEAELSSKTKESLAAAQALKAAQTELKDCKAKTAGELAEANDLSLSTGECLKLSASHKQVCGILGTSSPACIQVSHAVHTGCKAMNSRKASLEASEHAEMAQVDADYASIQEDSSNMKRYHDLLKANKIAGGHSAAWAREETGKLRQAATKRDGARKQREVEITNMHKAEQELDTIGEAAAPKPAATLVSTFTGKTPAQTGGWNSMDVQTKVHVLAAEESQGLASVDADYAQVQQEAHQKSAQEDLLKAGKMSGTKSTDWLQSQKQKVDFDKQEENRARTKKEADTLKLQKIQTKLSDMQHNVNN